MNGCTTTFQIILSNRLFLQNPPDMLRKLLIEQLKMPNPKWIENNRMGRWNRNTPQTLKFYKNISKGGLIIPRGYARQLIVICRRHKISYCLVDNRRTQVPVSFEFNGHLKPFQQTAVDRLLQKDFGTVSLPTGSGKTLVGLYMIAKRFQPSLIIVHNQDLAYQWIERIEQFLQIPADEVGLISDGNVKMGERITVALVQSLYKCTNDVFRKIGFLVVDECHRTPSRTFTKAVSVFDCRYMLGMSATPWRRDKLSKLIFWHLGDLHFHLDRKMLMESGDLLPAQVIFRETEFKPYHDPVREYSKMLAELVADDNRNQMITGDISREVRENSDVLLVISDRKAHCKILQALLQFRHHISSDLLTGDLSMDQRREILHRLNQGEVKVMIATGQLVGEGLDSSSLSTLFLVTPIRFSGRLIQYLGRVLRPAPGKSIATVYDYVDVHVPQLKAAARNRQKVYRGGG